MALPLGVFDSGLGGLTVVKQLQRKFPNLSIIYYGDTARVPYGTKSPETVTRFSRQIVDFLIAQEVQAIVVACNTASAAAVPIIQTEYSVPIYGVVEPGAAAAVSITTTGRIGVIGTNSTIRTSVYTRAIHAIDDSMEVFDEPCPLFVPLVEEGKEDHQVTEIIAREYTASLLEKDIDTLILGCTHYPLLQGALQKILPDHIKIIDSGVAAANSLTGKLTLDENSEPAYKYFVSDMPEKFMEIGARFLGHPMEDVYYFDVDREWEPQEIPAAPLIRE